MHPDRRGHVHALQGGRHRPDHPRRLGSGQGPDGPGIGNRRRWAHLHRDLGHHHDRRGHRELAGPRSRALPGDRDRHRFPRHQGRARQQTVPGHPALLHRRQPVELRRPRVPEELGGGHRENRRRLDRSGEVQRRRREVDHHRRHPAQRSGHRDHELRHHRHPAGGPHPRQQPGHARRQGRHQLREQRRLLLHGQPDLHLHPGRHREA